jgi:hypothetical protein
MGHLDFYDGLDPRELDFDNRLIILIEALYYYETKKKKWIQRCDLESNSNVTLNYFSKGRPSSFGGSFGRFITKSSDPSEPKDRRFFRCVKRSRKDTRIYLYIEQIKTEIEKRKKRNLESESLSLFRSRRKFDHFTKSISFTDSVSTADSVGIAVTKAQARTIPRNGSR